MAVIDITGQIFGRWVVIDKDVLSTKYVDSKVRWNCLCSCGVARSVSYSGLKSGSKSCGCLTKDVAKEMCVKRNTVHGDSKSKEHMAWKSMLSRCYNKRRKHYDKYGGRGIQVAPEWKNSYSKFLEDIGRAPEDGATWSVGRVDNNENYSASNCQWEVWTEQARNRGMLVNNTSGHTGVYFNKGKRGSGRFVAQWEDLSGTRQSRYFSVYKYGKDVAKQMAVKCREDSIASMNTEGAGYSDDHGIKRKVKEIV